MDLSTYTWDRLFADQVEDFHVERMLCRPPALVTSDGQSVSLMSDPTRSVETITLVMLNTSLTRKLLIQFTETLLAIEGVHDHAAGQRFVGVPVGKPTVVGVEEASWRVTDDIAVTHHDARGTRLVIEPSITARFVELSVGETRTLVTALASARSWAKLLLGVQEDAFADLRKTLGQVDAPRIPFGDETCDALNALGEGQKRCTSCGVLRGHVHDRGCKLEECSRCHEQLPLCVHQTR